jgi:hypothetical protein
MPGIFNALSAALGARNASPYKNFVPISGVKLIITAPRGELSYASKFLGLLNCIPATNFNQSKGL